MKKLTKSPTNQCEFKGKSPTLEVYNTEGMTFKANECVEIYNSGIENRGSTIFKVVDTQGKFITVAAQ